VKTLFDPAWPAGLQFSQYRWIRVNEQVPGQECIFEGNYWQWADVFFANPSVAEIRAFCEEHGWVVTFHERVPDAALALFDDSLGEDECPVIPKDRWHANPWPWISLIDDPIETFPPSDTIIEVHGAIIPDQAERTWVSSEMGDWMLRGDPSHWRPVSDVPRLTPAQRRERGLGQKIHVGEEAGEAIWISQKGVNPKTGKMWLTPRMQREAARIQANLETPPQSIPVTDDLEDAPDGAVIYIDIHDATYERVGDHWSFLHKGEDRER
jgi:hypothetical protein